MIVTDLKEPNSMDELHHFLGLTSYYRRFILLFTNKAKPFKSFFKRALNSSGQQSASLLLSTLKVLCVKPILQYPNTEKPYTIFSDASHYAYSEVLTHAAYGCDDLSPIAYTSGLFSDMQQKWTATEKETFAVYQVCSQVWLVLKRSRVHIMLWSQAEPFLSKGIAVSKLEWWAMGWQIIIIFVHIMGRKNILADAISRLKMLDIYKDQIEDPKKLKVTRIQHIKEVTTSKIHTLDSNYSVLNKSGTLLVKN